MHSLPPNVRRVGDRYRAVLTLSGTRYVGPLRVDVSKAVDDVARIREERANAAGHRGLRSLLDRHLRDLAARGAAPGTVEHETHHFAALVRNGFGEHADARAITPESVERYAKRRIDAGVRPSTVWRHELAVLRRLCAIVVADGDMRENPVTKARKPRRIDQERFDVLTRAEIRAIVRAVLRSRKRNRRQWAALVVLLATTGLRRAEVCRLRVRDVEFSAGRMFVRGKVRDRYVPLSRRARRVARWMCRGKRQDDPVTVGVHGVERAFASMQEVSGELRLSPHVLRHSFATMLVEKGVDVFRVATLLGHASPKMTWRYYHASDARQRDAIERLD